jgi:hypothetical protein
MKTKQNNKLTKHNTTDDTTQINTTNKPRKKTRPGETNTKQYRSKNTHGRNLTRAKTKSGEHKNGRTRPRPNNIRAKQERDEPPGRNKPSPCTSLPRFPPRTLCRRLWAVLLPRWLRDTVIQFISRPPVINPPWYRCRRLGHHSIRTEWLPTPDY